LKLEFDESEREEKKKIQEGFNKEFHDISNKLQSEVNEKRELAKRDNEIKMRVRLAFVLHHFNCLHLFSSVELHFHFESRKSKKRMN